MNKSTAFLCFLIVLLLSGSVPAALAQTQITIMNVDSLSESTADGQTVRKLIGNVHLRTEDMDLESDSAIQYLDRNLIEAFNIEITTENETVWSDTLFYNTGTEYSQFRGRVIIEYDNSTIFSHAIDYDREYDVALFQNDVRFEDEQGVLLAENGYYFQRADIAFFKGNVQISDSTQYLEADSLYMNRESDFYQLFDRVYAKDFRENVTFSGDFLEADSAGHRLLRGNAWMMQVNEAETDTSHLNSGIIDVQEDDTTTFINAYSNVRIWSPSFAAIADTAHYRDDSGEFRLLSNPAAWQNNIQLSGPFIRALIEEEEIRFLESYSNPVAVMQDSTTNRFNQITGDSLRAYFESGEIRRIEVTNNSELIFQNSNEEGEPDGLIELVANDIVRITFFEGEIDSVTAIRNPDGTYLPEDPENVDRQLPGFRWEPDLRPEKPEIGTARLPAASDEPMFDFPPRYQAHLDNSNREN